MSERYAVAEVFGPTIQGEGAMIGAPTFFVRFGGCDFRCAWCDSPHAVLPQYRAQWERMSPPDVLGRLQRMGAKASSWITLSGGNPALQRLEPLLVLGHDQYGFRFAMETQGSVARPWFNLLDHLILSPKPPSAGDCTAFAALRKAYEMGPESTILKVVVFDEADFTYAANVFDAFPAAECFVSVGNAETDPTEPVAETRARLLDAYAVLAERVASTMPNVRVLPQLHALAWGNRRGV